MRKLGISKVWKHQWTMELESSGTGHNALLETNSASLDNEEYTLCNKLERVAQCRHTGPDCSCSAAYQRCAGQVLQESKVPLIPVHSDSRVPLGGPVSTASLASSPNGAAQRWQPCRASCRVFKPTRASLPTF